MYTERDTHETSYIPASSSEALGRWGGSQSSVVVPGYTFECDNGSIVVWPWWYTLYKQQTVKYNLHDRWPHCLGIKFILFWNLFVLKYCLMGSATKQWHYIHWNKSDAVNWRRRRQQYFWNLAEKVSIVIRYQEFGNSAALEWIW